MAATKTLYLKHESGATHRYDGRRAAKLFKEIKVGRGNPEITVLVESGYEGFLGPDGLVWDFEALKPEHFLG